ncbi:MAG: hypothetical protein KDD39_16610, partial [Bdellovibrionales bacterium]|nr:hypothetical protein [Bdellovibrionales bacterium]
MRSISIILLLGLNLIAVADDCKLDQPIDIGVNDPRVSWIWHKRITLADVKVDPRPNFRDYSQDNPPATNIVAVELYSPEGVCGGEALAGRIGLTADCSKAKEEGAWKPEECTVDFLEYGGMGFSHVYSVNDAECSVENSEENGVHSYSTVLKLTGDRDTIRAQ